MIKEKKKYHSLSRTTNRVYTAVLYRTEYERNINSNNCNCDQCTKMNIKYNTPLNYELNIDVESAHLRIRQAIEENVFDRISRKGVINFVRFLDYFDIK